MTSLASYLASLAGAAPQEGQKATPASGTGASGLFAALLETTTADGEAATEIPHSADPTTILPTAPNTVDVLPPEQVVAGDDALSEALTSGITADASSGDVEAVILEEPLDADVDATLTEEPASPTSPASPAPVAAPTDNTAPETGTPGPSAEQIPASTAAPSPPTPTSHANPTAQTAAARDGGAGKSPERILHRHAAPEPGAQDTPVRPTGLDNAVQRASDTGRAHGLTTAPQRPVQTSENGNVNVKAPETGTARPLQTTPAGEADADADIERPIRAKADTPLPVTSRVRVDLVQQPLQIVQRFIKTDAGQTLIQVQERMGGETTSISSPPTLTVSVQAPAASPGPASAPAPHVPVGALAVHIAHQANNGARRFEIRLDPPELGRIDVRLDVSREGQVMTHLVVERAETLDLLLRDAKQLERALQDAGLDTSEKGMKFSLKDQGFGGDDKGFPDDEPGMNAGADDSDGDDPAEPEMPPPQRYVASTGLDIRI